MANKKFLVFGGYCVSWQYLKEIKRSMPHYWSVNWKIGNSIRRVAYHSSPRYIMLAHPDYLVWWIDNWNESPPSNSGGSRFQGSALFTFGRIQKSKPLNPPLDSSLNTCLVVHKFHLDMIIFIESFFIFFAKWHIIVPAWLCGPKLPGCVRQCVCYQGAALHPPAIWPVSHL